MKIEMSQRSIYTIKKGDSLETTAKLIGISKEELKRFYNTYCSLENLIGQDLSNQTQVIVPNLDSIKNSINSRKEISKIPIGIRLHKDFFASTYQPLPPNKNNTWNWKWNGSEEEVSVSGTDLITIVEKMYRLETSHFTSKQYQHCGTGGMEVFGDAPYYGWDSSLFTETPIGTWSAFEGAGLSGQGGNAQVTTRQKEFIKFPTVISGMEYKVQYIIKYNGKFERWFNKNDTTAQSAYRTTLGNIRARFINEFISN
jgi:hypothetical protein